MKELNFEKTKSKIQLEIQQQQTMVLATCKNQRVTARNIYCMSDGMILYFITSKAYLKYQQIKANPNVALCFNTIQIEGVAIDLGHPLLEENTKKLQSCFMYNKEMIFYEKYKNSVLIAVKIKGIEMWSENGREYIDLDKQVAYRKG